MRNKSLKFCLIGSVVLLFYLNVAQAGTPTLQQIQKAVDDYRARYNIPAVQVSLSMPDEYTTLDFVSGTTIQGGKNKLTPGDLFQFGSNTKSFTAAIILQLESEGKLNINDPIVKYVPQYLQWKNVTIRQLLNHTSGIFNYTEDSSFIAQVERDLGKVWQPQEIVSYAAKHVPYFVPGKGFHYSNTNFILAGMIIRNVTGVTYTNAINLRLLGSTTLNLVNTYYADVYTADIMSHIVHGYSAADNHNYSEPYKDVTSPNISWAGSAGAIVSNTRDFVRWPRLLLQTTKVLKPAELQEMESRICMSKDDGCTPGSPVTSAIDGYGLGIGGAVFDPYGIIWTHSGGTVGYVTIFAWIPKYNTSIAVATNVYRPDQEPGELLRKIMMILYHSQEWQDYRLQHNIAYISDINESELETKLSKIKNM